MENRHKPVWQMVRDAAEELGPRMSNSDVRNWILQQYRHINPKTITSRIMMCTVNLPSRVHFPENRVPRRANGQYDFLFRVSRGELAQYKPDQHGVWEIAADDDGNLTVREAFAQDTVGGENTNGPDASLDRLVQEPTFGFHETTMRVDRNAYPLFAPHIGGRGKTMTMTLVQRASYVRRALSFPDPINRDNILDLLVCAAKSRTIKLVSPGLCVVHAIGLGNPAIVFTFLINKDAGLIVRDKLMKMSLSMSDKGSGIIWWFPRSVGEYKDFVTQLPDGAYHKIAHHPTERARQRFMVTAIPIPLSEIQALPKPKSRRPTPVPSPVEQPSGSVSASPHDQQEDVGAGMESADGSNTSEAIEQDSLVAKGPSDDVREFLKTMGLDVQDSRDDQELDLQEDGDEDEALDIEYDDADMGSWESDDDSLLGDDDW